MAQLNYQGFLGPNTGYGHIPMSAIMRDGWHTGITHGKEQIDRQMNEWHLDHIASISVSVSKNWQMLYERFDAMDLEYQLSGDTWTSMILFAEVFDIKAVQFRCFKPSDAIKLKFLF